MKRRNNKLLLSVILTGTLLGSCKAPQVLDLTAVKKEVPARYKNGGNDSLSVTQMRLKEYFKDPLLLQLIEEVLAANQDYRIAEKRIGIAKAFLSRSKGALLPQVNAQVTGSGTRYGKYTMEGVGNFDTNLSGNVEEDQKINTKISPDYWLGLVANWELDLWGKLRNMKRAAQHRYLSSQYGKNLVAAAVVTQTAILYYELIGLDQEMDILNKNIRLQEKALEIVKVQKEAGRATELALQQFEAQKSNTEAIVAQLQYRLFETEQAIVGLTGKYQGTVNRSEKIDVHAMTYLAQHGQPEQLLVFRPDVMMAYEELAATHADAKAARAAFYPSLNVSAYGALNAFNGNVLFNFSSMAFRFLGGLTAPVFQQNQIRSQFKIANAQQEIALLEFQKTSIAAYQEVNNIVQLLESNRNTNTLKQKEVAALERSVDISNDLYISGYAGYLEIIAAQKSKLAAEMDLVNTQKNEALALIHLYKALGGGWQI